MKELQAWLNARPRLKYSLSLIEGSLIGGIGSYAIGWLNGTGTLTRDGLKRTLVGAISTGVTAVYNTWKTSPAQAKIAEDLEQMKKAAAGG